MGAMVALVVVKRSKIGLTARIRGHVGAAARDACSYWRKGTDIPWGSSHRVGTSTEVGI